MNWENENETFAGKANTSSRIQQSRNDIPDIMELEQGWRRFQLLDRSLESFGRFADYESPGCKADMAEGSAEEEQSSTAAPASPPADLRTLNTQLSPPYHHQSHLQPRLQHLQHPNMLATAVPPRHSHSMLSHQVKTEAELDAPCDVPLNLKSEVSPPWIHYLLSTISLERWINVPWSIKIRSNQCGNGITSALVK